MHRTKLVIAGLAFRRGKEVYDGEMRCASWLVSIMQAHASSYSKSTANAPAPTSTPDHARTLSSLPSPNSATLAAEMQRLDRQTPSLGEQTAYTHPPENVLRNGSDNWPHHQLRNEVFASDNPLFSHQASRLLRIKSTNIRKASGRNDMS